MIDTIRFGIPLDVTQYHQLFRAIQDSDHWQWVKYQFSTDEKQLVRVRGLAEIDQESFKREIFWDIPEDFRDGETYLILELSLPKFWYRHNIWLLYNFFDALDKLQKELERILGIKFADWMEWKLYRLDVCYAWKCPTQDIAHNLINSLKRLHFPRKKPIIYDDSIIFKSESYSLKFYLKYPEFMKHDYKILRKENIGKLALKKLQEQALGVLRCEATLRTKKLKYDGLYQIADLFDGSTTYTNDEELKTNYSGVEENLNLQKFVAACIVKHHNPEATITVDDFGLHCSDSEYEKHWSGGIFYAPACVVEINGVSVNYKGGGFVSEFTPSYLEVFRKVINKLLGENRGMNEVDQVKAKLFAAYKPAKANRLLGFWLTVQRLGSKEVKQISTRNQYFDSKRALKEAGVSLVEPVKVIHAADKFRRDFRFEVPSQFVVNSVDYPRGSTNIIRPETEQGN